MNTTLMAVLSLAVIISLFVVLVGFISHLTRTLGRTGANLARALDITTTIRHDCENVDTGIQAMNMNLYRVAAGLSNVGDATEKRAKELTGPPAAPPSTSS